MGFLAWLGLTSAGTPLQIGDPAPEAIARDEQGREIRLSEIYGEGTVLIYFYPKADTPGCTAQACSLRDDFAALQARGVRILGVSADRPAAQLRFKEKYRLPFTVLSDADCVVAQAFHVPLLLGMPHRQAFLIHEGRIVWRDLRAATREQAREVLQALEKPPFVRSLGKIP